MENEILIGSRDDFARLGYTDGVSPFPKKSG